MSEKILLPKQPVKTDWRFGLFSAGGEVLYFADCQDSESESGLECVVNHEGFAVTLTAAAPEQLFFSLEELEYFVSLAKFVREHSSIASGKLKGDK